MSNDNNIPSPLLVQAFGAANFGFILLDSDKKIIFWNDWMVSHSGIRNDDVLGNNLIVVFPKMDSPRFDSATHDCLVNSMSSILSPQSHPYIFPLATIQSKDGAANPVGQMVTISPLKSEAGESFCMIQIADVTADLARENILREQSKNLASEIEKITQELQLEIKRREHTEASLRDSEKQFRSLYENAP
ncbi:MAG: PAS domain-containing protein, partial [Rhodospirillaceae bacterium]|nr:PAS domain-containing protein [Rhodospirillaceae bacterium]